MSKLDEEVKVDQAAAAQPQVNNEIKETTGAAVEVYEDYDTTELADSNPKKKRFKKRFVVIGIIALLAIGGLVAYFNGKKNAIVTVETAPVYSGTIENILSISGTVESADSKSYFADVTAPIDKLNVKVGDKVRRGDVLYTFDQESLDLAQKNAELAITQAKGSYNSLYSPVGNADRKYAQGMNAQQINDRLDAITAEIDAINNKITEKSDRMNQTLTDLQKTAIDINQNGVMDGTNGDYDYLNRRENDNNESEMSESNRQMALAVQQSISDVSYALQHDPEIEAWKNQITALQEEQSHLSSAKASQLNPGTVQSTKASLESTELNQEDTISKIEAARAGVTADFNGVITAIPANVVEGATVTNGTQIMTIANLEDVQVSIQVSKSDLPKVSVGQTVDVTINNKSYNGEVSKISGTATKNANGVAVVDTVIKIKNPDSDIILGVEASNKIHAEKADDVIVLPYEYVQTDSTGDYVYVVENGVVTRRDVIIGISNSTEAQITEGLSVGDEVISSDVSNLTEGMPVQIAALEQ